VKPSHYLKQGRALPKPLSAEHITQLFATIEHPMDRALFLLMLRCGLRVSEVASLKVSAIDWEQQALRVEQGKGRKDRVVYLSPDAVASLRECWQKRPLAVPGEYVFWNQKRQNRPLSIKAIQKKMARYAEKAGDRRQLSPPAAHLRLRVIGARRGDCLHSGASGMHR
jgi:site-specific recombinase XerD